LLSTFRNLKVLSWYLESRVNLISRRLSFVSVDSPSFAINGSIQISIIQH
jgi:hypothetical protein